MNRLHCFWPSTLHAAMIRAARVLQPVALLVAIFCICYVCAVTALSCADGQDCHVNSSPGRSSTPDDAEAWFRKLGVQAASLAVRAWPSIQPVGISCVAGYACGLLARRVLQALVIGAAFVTAAVQALAYLEWVTVHWDRINGDLARLLGTGRPGEATWLSETEKVDASALLALASERLAAAISQGLPSVAGFTTGLTLAFMPGMAIF